METRECQVLRSALFLMSFVLLIGAAAYAKELQLGDERSIAALSWGPSVTRMTIMTSADGAAQAWTGSFRSISWPKLSDRVSLEGHFATETTITAIWNPTWVYTLTSQVLSVAMSESPRLLVVGTHSNGLIVFNDLGEILWSALADYEEVHATVSRDGSLVAAVARESGRVYAYNREGKALWSYDTGQALPTSWEAERWLIDMSANGDTIVAVLDDGYVVALDREGNILWQAGFRTEQPFTDLRCESDQTGGEWIECIQSMDVSGDGNTIVIGTWDSDTDKAVLFSFSRTGALRWHRTNVRAESVAVSQNGEITVIDAEVIYCFDSQGNLLWRAPDPSERWQLSWSDSWHKRVAISGDGQRIYGAVGGWLAGFDRDGNELWSSTIPSPFNIPSWLETDSYGQHLAVTYISPGGAFLYDGDGRRLGYWISPEGGWVTDVSISSDGRHVLAGTCCGRNSVLFWDLALSGAVPIAEFEATPLAGFRPLEVRFTNLSSGAIDSQVWDFGDGTSSTLYEPTHIYTTTGAFTVTLTVTGSNGSDSATKPEYILVLEPPGQTPPFDGTLAPQDTNYIVAQDDAELDVASQLGEGLTIEAWVNVNHGTHTNGNAEIVSKPGAYALYLTGDPSWTCIYFKLHTTCGDPFIGVCYRLGPGWHHIVGQLKHVLGVISMMSIYVDGYEQVSSTLGMGCTVNNSTAPLIIGRNLDGQIDELRISAMARYASAYVVPYWTFSCDGQTRALWHFDESQGATVFHDSCGIDNALHLLTPRLYLPLIARSTGMQ